MVTVTMAKNIQKGGAKHHLTINERILLHLLGNSKFKDRREAPFSVTQKGIAKAVNIRWNHVPRAMAKLKKMGYVFEVTSHIEAKTRKQKVYFLTDEGSLSAKNQREKISNWEVFLKDQSGQIIKLKLSEVNSALKTNFSSLKLYLCLSEDNIIEAKDLLLGAKEEAPKKGLKTFYVSGEISWPEELIGRESELKNLKDWIDSDEHRTIVIYGSIGIGKSSLMAEVLQIYKDKKDIFWYQMPENDSQKNLLIQFSKFLSELGRADLSSYLSAHETIELDKVMNIIEKALMNKEVIVAFDNYFKVSEEIVDFFSALSDLAAKNEGIKIMITARETTPFYCRFYDKRDVHEKKIVELTVKGLDVEGCRRLLGTPDIDDDALRKIFLMTRGHPLTINLIKRGDVNNLKRIKGFSRQEASLLLYLKGVEKKS